MRLWSVAPEYLDRQGLLALWREGLLAQKVLAGKTTGYRNHPQLNRFRNTNDPMAYISFYLSTIYQEASRRGYNFDFNKINPLKKNIKTIKVNKGQVEYEFKHLLNKLKKRDLYLYNKFKGEINIKVNKLFNVIEGGIEGWEVIK